MLSVKPYKYIYTDKPAHAVTCIKRSPFSSPVIENIIWIEPLLRGHPSYKATFSVSQRWPLNTGLTVYSKLNMWFNFGTLIWTEFYLEWVS